MKLIICDVERKVMRVHKGTSLLLENQLLNTPVALCVIFSDNSAPRIASLAVAAGPYVFIYRQLRPYKKWTCPVVELTREEYDVWNSFRLDGKPTLFI